LLGSARAAVRCGVRTLKVKVSRTDFGTELEQLSELRSEVGNAVALRLDANQKWPAAEARRNLELLSKIGPELVEEPVRDADFRALAHSSVPVALDESLQQPGLLERIDPFIHACQIRAIVLKPTTLGGFLRCLRLAEQAGALGLEVLVSHTLDGPIAMAGAAALALAVASTEHASGLARHPALPAWPEQRVFAITPAHVIRTEHPGLGLGEVHVRAA
jgi:L-alanine-DL-glutamate epimerase-like enolase superfamily enzyme